jgi:hypothetical protein
LNPDFPFLFSEGMSGFGKSAYQQKGGGDALPFWFFHFDASNCLQPATAC